MAIKTILGFINLAVIMGLLLFVPAQTINYLQAWVYLAVFFTGVSNITIYIYRNDKQLLQSRLKVGAIAEKRQSQKIIQGFASIGFAEMFLLAGFDRQFHWSHISEAVWIAADVFVGLSMVFMFLVFRKNTFLSATIEIQSNQHIVTDGPYAIVRHPMYSAALLLFISSPLALGSYWALLSFPFMIIVIAMRCTDEEKMLNEQLAAYKEYCNKVKYRLIPFVW